MEIEKTNLAIRVNCVCGNTVAASLIYGGDTIEEDFTKTIAIIHNKGGKVEFVNTDEIDIRMHKCTCKKLKK